MIQHESTQGGDGLVQLVIMTHVTSEGAARDAIDEIDKLDVVQSKSVRLRVHD